MKSPLRCLSALFFCLAAVPQLASADQSDLRTDMSDLLETFHETYGFPGATVAYVASDGVVEPLAVGLADVESGITMIPDHRMLSASIGKSIWGALVLKLEADGTLNRSDRVSSYLGHLAWFSRVPNADQITIGQLLTHTSGLPDHVHMDGVGTNLIELGGQAEFDPVDLVSFILDEPALFEAGSAWAYSDTGYVLLGLVLQKVTQTDVFELARESLLHPLGLTATDPSNTPTLEGLAVGYTVDGNPFGLPPRTMDESGRLNWNPVVEWTGGGFAATSDDLARWGHALFRGRALEADYLESLLSGVLVHPDAPGVLYGAGVAIYQETPHGPVYGHGGWIPGYVSSLRHYADHDPTIAFQINSDVGVVDDSTDLVSALEAALAETAIRYLTQ